MKLTLGLVALSIALAPAAQACDGLSHYDPYHDICTPGQTDQAPFYTPIPGPPQYTNPYYGSLEPGLDYN